MPKMQQTVQATTTHDITIAPSVAAKLRRSLKTYQSVKEQIKALEAQADKQKEIIDALRDETGETSIKLDGFTITMVAGTRRVFNPKAYVAAGGDMAIYNDSFDVRPNKPYTKISLPNESDKE